MKSNYHIQPLKTIFNTFELYNINNVMYLSFTITLIIEKDAFRLMRLLILFVKLYT